MSRFLFVSFFLLTSLSANAQSFDGRYDGTLLLTRGGDECGDKSQKFRAEIKGATIRIIGQRTDKPFEGTIAADGQFLANGAYSIRGSNVTFEWRGQILSTKSGLGSLLMRGEHLCQFLLSIRQN